MIEGEVTRLMYFDELEDKVLKQARVGTKSFAEAVMKDAWKSMPVMGRSPSDPNYRHAPYGEPPYSHTETLRNSLAVAEGSDGFWYAGTKFSEVGLRGVYLEFGGRELKKDEVGRPRKRKISPHPFIGPALDRQIDTFVPHVTGTFTKR